MYLFLLILISSMCWSLRSSANHTDRYLNNTPNDEYFNICGPMDTIIVYAPDTAVNGIYWDPPIGPNRVGVDSVIITATTIGSWTFNSDEVYKHFYVYIISSLPYEPPSMAHDTSFCTSTFSLTLDAQNHLPGGHASTYLWSTGETTRIITVTTPGTYTVTVTGACGVGVYDINVTQSNPNAPNLGPDISLCTGDNETLDPMSTNVTSYLWSTGATTPTITVNLNGEYWVYVQDNNGCSGYDTVQVTMIHTESQEILLATINTNPASPEYGNNMVTWYVNPALIGVIDSVYIYREMGTNNYVLVGTAAYTDGEWSDNVNSITHAWKYKISLVGLPCGESVLSSSVQTIHSWVSQFGGVYTIQWDEYIIGSKSTVTWYKILSGNGLNQLTVRDSVSGTLTSLTLPNTTDSIFVVGAELSSKSFSGLALSNKTPNPVTTGMIDNPYVISFGCYPNPATDYITIDISARTFQIKVFNMLGQEVLSEQNKKTISIGTLSKGIYTVKVIVDGMAQSQQKFIKN